MNLPIEINAPAVLVGGGPVPREAYLRARTYGDFLLAADGGADQIVNFGHIPDAVIGDLDSISAAARDVIPAKSLHHIPEQDSTDFDKALRSIRAPLVLALGFTGGRVDHELAALHVLLHRCDRAVILLSDIEVIFHVPARVSLNLPAQMRVSLFPLDAVHVRGVGLRWPEDGLDIDLHPADRIGTSNETRADGPVHLQTDRSGLLGIVPHAALDAVIEGLDHADFHSPRRAAAVKTV